MPGNNFPKDLNNLKPNIDSKVTQTDVTKTEIDEVLGSNGTKPEGTSNFKMPKNEGIGVDGIGNNSQNKGVGADGIGGDAQNNDAWNFEGIKFEGSLDEDSKNTEKPENNDLGLSGVNERSGEGRQSVTSKVKDGIFGIADKAKAGVGGFFRNAFNPKTYSNAWNGATSKISKGLNIKQGVAKAGLLSLITATGIAGYTGVSGLIQQRKSDNVAKSVEYVHECEMTKLEETSTNSSAGGGDKTHERQVYNVAIMQDLFDSQGYSENFAIGCISCWLVESNVLSERIESDYRCTAEAEALFTAMGASVEISPYKGTPCDGQTAVQLYKEYGNGVYSSTGGNTINSGYMVGGDVCPGIGLAQWTAGRGVSLCEKVDAVQSAGYNYSVIDITYQLGFLLSEWVDNGHFDATSGDWTSNCGSKEAATAFCFRYMEFGGGTPPADLTAERVAKIPIAEDLWAEAAANDEFTADITDMASILADADVTAAAKNLFEPVMCMTTAHMTLDSIPDMAYSLSYVTPMDYTNADHAAKAGGDTTVTSTTYSIYPNREDAPDVMTDLDWPVKKGTQTCLRACTDYYRLVHYLVCNGVGVSAEIKTSGPAVGVASPQLIMGTLSEDGYVSSCDRTTATIIRAAGADDRFSLGNPEGQIDYIYKQSGGTPKHTTPQILGDAMKLTEDRRYAGGGDGKEGALDDANALWDAVGVINGDGSGRSFYYPYSASTSLSPGSIFISGGTMGTGGAGADVTPGSEPNNYYGKRIGNNFWNVTNNTSRHIMVYSGSAALQKRYGKTLIDEYYISLGYNSVGTLSTNRNGASISQYETLLYDDMTPGVSTYMSDGAGNKGSVAKKANDKYESFYTVRDDTDDATGEVYESNDKTGLMTYKSRSEIYADFVEILYTKSCYDFVDGKGFVYNGTEEFADADNLMPIEHPLSWPLWKIEAYADLCYRYQQMARFSAATQYVSIPTEADTNIYRNGTKTYYVYAYGYKDSTYEDVLYFDEDTCKTLYNDGNGAWYYDQTWVYDQMISNDMLQDLIQLYTVKEKDDYSDDTRDLMENLPKESFELCDGDKLLIGGSHYSGNKDYCYGLMTADWHMILDYYNDPGLCDISEMKDNYYKTFNEWFLKAIELRNIDDNKEKFEFDLKDPVGNKDSKKTVLSITNKNIDNQDNIDYLAKYMWLHFYNRNHRRNYNNIWNASDYGAKYMWAVYKDDGTGIGSVSELEGIYSSKGDEGKEALKSITIGPATIPNSTSTDDVYTLNRYTGVPSWFKNRVLNPYKLLDDAPDGALNSDAAVKGTDYDGNAFGVDSIYTRTRPGCSDTDNIHDKEVTVTADNNLDKFIAKIKSEYGVTDYTVTMYITCPDGKHASKMMSVAYGSASDFTSFLKSNACHPCCYHNGSACPATCCSAPDDDDDWTDPCPNLKDDIVTIRVQFSANLDEDGGTTIELEGDKADTLNSNLSAIDALDLPEYVMIPCGSQLRSFDVYNGKGALIIDSNFNQYKDEPADWTDPFLAMKTQEFMSQCEAYNREMYKTIFGKSEDILIEDAVPTDYKHNQKGGGASSIIDSTPLVNAYDGDVNKNEKDNAPSLGYSGAAWILQICGVCTNVYHEEAYPQHLIYTGMGTKTGTWDGDTYITSGLDYEDPKYVSYYDPKIDPTDHEHYVYDSTNPKLYDPWYKNEYGLTEAQNAALKTIKNNTGFWMTDGSIGTHGAQSTWYSMDSYMNKFTYRVFVSLGAKDVNNVDNDTVLNEFTGSYKNPAFESVVTDEEDFNYFDPEKDYNKTESFIYDVITTDGYYLYDGHVEWDEQKVVGAGQNSYYARLMHIWNDMESLPQNIKATYDY